MSKKNQSKKTQSKKPSKPVACLRQIDANTVQMSDDESFPKATKIAAKAEVPKGMVRVDDHNVISA